MLPTTATASAEKERKRNMHAFYILLTIAAFALGSAASATLPTSVAGDSQQADYAPETTTDALYISPGAANDFTGK